MFSSVRAIANFDGPIGEVIDTKFLENGLKIVKMSSSWNYWNYIGVSS